MSIPKSILIQHPLLQQYLFPNIITNDQFQKHLTSFTIQIPGFNTILSTYISHTDPLPCHLITHQIENIKNNFNIIKPNLQFAPLAQFAPPPIITNPTTSVPTSQSNINFNTIFNDFDFDIDSVGSFQLTIPFPPQLRQDLLQRFKHKLTTQFTSNMNENNNTTKTEKELEYEKHIEILSNPNHPHFFHVDVISMIKINDLMDNDFSIASHPIKQFKCIEIPPYDPNATPQQKTNRLNEIKRYSGRNQCVKHGQATLALKYHEKEKVGTNNKNQIGSHGHLSAIGYAKYLDEIIPMIIEWKHSNTTHVDVHAPTTENLIHFHQQFNNCLEQYINPKTLAYIVVINQPNVFPLTTKPTSKTPTIKIKQPDIEQVMMPKYGYFIQHVENAFGLYQKH